MNYTMQVRVLRKETDTYEWHDCQSSEGNIYYFDTWDEANSMLRRCYPDQCLLGDRTRVRVNPPRPQFEKLEKNIRGTHA